MNRPRLPSFTENKHKQRERIRAENLEKLDKIIDNSSEKNRDFFIVYLGLLIYVQAIIFSTTDLQLLIASEGLKLPIIDLSVPLVGFYVVIPIFVIALHFNFLQNLESHHYKLMRWQEAHHNGVVPRSSIYPFLFDYAILERKSQLLRWVYWANSLLCYNLAPITLGLLLIRYSDRQDFLVTAWHYLIFVVDVYLVWKLRLAMEDNKHAEPLPTHLPLWQLCTDSFRYGLRGIFGALILLETLLTGMIGGTSDTDFVKYIQHWTQPISNMALASTIFDDTYNGNIIPSMQAYSRSIEWLLPRITINANETVWKPDKNELEATATFAGYKDWVIYFNKHGKGFQSTCKSLRFASLPWQDLTRAQLSGIKFQGANLMKVQVQGADLTQAQLQGADLSSALMQGTDLTGAQLQGADLSSALMQGADLTGAQLQGADLSSVQMEGTDLSSAQMQGAEIDIMSLEGAILGSTAILHSSDTRLETNNTSDRLFIEKTLPVPVFAVLGDLFEYEKINWSELKQLADTIPRRQSREKYDERILLAEKSDQSKIIEKSLHHKPAAIAKNIFPYVCLTTNNYAERLKSVQAFRQQYIGLANKLPDFEYLEDDPELQSLLKDIDRKICTLEECADLRNNIEGMNCKPYIKKSAKKKTLELLADRFWPN